MVQPHSGFEILGPLEDAIGPGAAGDVLASAGAGNIPVWTDPSGLGGTLIAMSIADMATAIDGAALDSVPASYFENVFAIAEVADIFEHANLSESKAEAIWHHANFTREATVEPELTAVGYAKVLNIFEEGVARTATSPSTKPEGIGGDSSVIWHCDDVTDKVYELKTSDLSASRSAASPSTSPSGIGGDSSVIWHCDDTADKVYELKTSDLSASRSAASLSTLPSGIGGDSSVIWHCDQAIDKVYELKTSDLSASRSAASPSTGPKGIGGDSSVIWHCDGATDKVYELKTSDLSASRSAASPSTTPAGIGGDSSVIWHCDSIDKVYILGT